MFVVLKYVVSFFCCSLELVVVPFVVVGCCSVLPEFIDGSLFGIVVVFVSLLFCFVCSVLRVVVVSSLLFLLLFFLWMCFVMLLVELVAGYTSFGCFSLVWLCNPRSARDGIGTVSI